MIRARCPASEVECHTPVEISPGPLPGATLDVDTGYIYRTVPKGAGEPEWRMKARQALLDAVDEVSQASLFGNGKVVVNGKDCSTIQALRHELEKLAEDAGDKRRIKGEAYQPDYDVLVEEALQRDTYLIYYSGLPKTRKGEK